MKTDRPSSRCTSASLLQNIVFQIVTFTNSTNHINYSYHMSSCYSHNMSTNSAYTCTCKTFILQWILCNDNTAVQCVLSRLFLFNEINMLHSILSTDFPSLQLCKSELVKMWSSQDNHNINWRNKYPLTFSQDKMSTSIKTESHAHIRVHKNLFIKCWFAHTE